MRIEQENEYVMYEMQPQSYSIFKEWNILFSFLTFPGCHNTSRQIFWQQQSVFADWKYFDNNCPWWQVILLNVKGECCLRLKISKSLLFLSDILLQPLSVSTQTTRLSQLDIFYTAVSINEVIIEQLRVGWTDWKWCFEYAAWSKAHQCQSMSCLWNNGQLLICTCTADNWHWDKHSSYRWKYTQKVEPHGN